MGKKKKKNVDFQKVKLKVGKRLPKGLNVTDTSFKAKKIILLNQIKAKPQGIPTCGSLSIQDILKRLQNYSPSTRHDMLSKMKDLLSQNTNLIPSNLSRIVERLSEIILDKDAHVRKAVLSVLSLVLQNVKEGEIAPFFPVLCSYLSCAMTHILAAIQRDSLLFFNLLLNYFPALLLRSSNQMLQNFLEQISSQNLQQPKRMLIVKPSGKTTNQFWRLKVLRQLEKFLEALIQQLMDKDKSHHYLHKEVHWYSSKPVFIPLCPNMHPIFGGGNHAPHTMMSMDEIKKYVLSIVPLLFDTWVEASTSEEKSTTKLLTSEMSEILECTLHILKMLGECVELVSTKSAAENLVEWFQKTYCSSFIQYFMFGFPYTVSQGGQRRRRKSEKTVSIVKVNLLVCSLYVFISGNEQFAPSKDHYFAKIYLYLSELICKGEVHEKSEMVEVLKVIKRLMEDCEAEMSFRILAALCETYKSFPPPSATRQLLFSFFVEQLMHPKFQYLIGSEVIQAWLKCVPSELESLVNHPSYFRQHLDAANKMAAHKMIPLLEGLQDSAEQVIGLLTKVSCSESRQDDLQWAVIELISKMPTLSLSVLKHLVSVICEADLNTHNLKCFLQILSRRYQNSPDIFINFILSIVVGTGCFRQATFIQPAPFQESEVEHTNLSVFRIYPCEPHIWQKHMRKIMEASDVLLCFVNKDISNNVINLLDIILKREEPFTTYSASGILLVLTQHLQSGKPLDGHMYFLDVLFSLWSYCFSERKKNPDEVVVKEMELLAVAYIREGCLAQAICQRISECIPWVEDINKAQYMCHCILTLLRNSLCEVHLMPMISDIMRRMEANVSHMAVLSEEIWWQAVIYELSRHLQSIA